MYNPVDTENAPKVALGGQLWPVPPLAARHNKIVDPLILSLLPLFAEWDTDRAGALAKLGSAHYESLQEISFQGLKRAHPQLTRDQFLDLPITLPELVAAFAIIAKQTGIFERAGPGEASAEGIPPDSSNSPTGTPSSPMSAI
jgi:hypothetical protein